MFHNIKNLEGEGKGYLFVHERTLQCCNHLNMFGEELGRDVRLRLPGPSPSRRHQARRLEVRYSTFTFLCSLHFSFIYSLSILFFFSASLSVSFSWHYSAPAPSYNHLEIFPRRQGRDQLVTLKTLPSGRDWVRHNFSSELVVSFIHILGVSYIY